MLTGGRAFESWGSQGPASLKGYKREKTITAEVQKRCRIAAWLVACPGRDGKFFNLGKIWYRWCLCFKKQPAVFAREWAAGLGWHLRADRGINVEVCCVVKWDSIPKKPRD